MVLIVDYGLGNLFSVAKAFEALGISVTVSGEPQDLRNADRIVLPGVGAFGDGMRYLREKGLDKILTEEVLGKGKPFLGICLGLQLLAETGEEYGEHAGLGWIKGRVQKIDAEKYGLKVPHIGWNELVARDPEGLSDPEREVIRPSLLLRGITPTADFYFVHSYHLVCQDPKDLVATATYGEKITTIIEHGNILATQFHPEKSQDNGLKLLENFLSFHP